VGLPSGLPVVDHHCHLSPHGDGVEAVRRFRAAGGTHLFLATQNYLPETPVTLEQYREQFATTEQLARTAHEATGVVVYNVLAPYPVDLLRASESIGIPAALELHRAALDLAADEVRAGRAVALGEVGRPHFPVPELLVEPIRLAFQHALGAARDAHCPVVVHSDDLDRDGFLALGREAVAAGLPPGKTVKHYARARVPEAVSTGVAPSYLAKRSLVSEVIRDPGPWFCETDYLDDPARPGAVLDLATVPRRAAAVAALGAEAAERLWVPFVRSVEAVYGLTPEVGPGGPR
jgi:TatD-related deoxyribonuclease